MTLVTKGFCAMPELCEAANPLVDSFGDSRVSNIKRLPEAKPRVLIRIPMPSEATETVRHADISLNSELSTLAILNAAAGEAGVIHKVILMADLGDLREGYFSLDNLLADAAIAKDFQHLQIIGLGVNLACYGGVIPTRGLMTELLRWAEALENLLGRSLDVISGGNSSSLPLAFNGDMPAGINNLRLGESILCGRDPVTGAAFPEMRGDVFTIEGEIVEIKEKPSSPGKVTGLNAFGETPDIVDRGRRLRAILAFGRQDIAPDCLTPLDPNMIILGASSDHLLTDIHDSDCRYRVGDVAAFSAAYPSILRACASAYVEKRFV